MITFNLLTKSHKTWLIVSPVSVNPSLAVRPREEGVDGDLDAVDEEEAQAHEQLREGVVRV